MLHTIIGLMNSGKTLFMTRQLFIDYCKGREIYSNYPLGFPHTLLSKEDLERWGKEQPNLLNISLGFDEIWLWADCRKSAKNTIMTYFFLQSSKGDTKIYLSAQDDKQIDIRVRNNQHFLSVCTRKLILNGEKFKINDSIRILPKPIQPYLYINVKTYSQKLIGFNRQMKLKKNRNIKAQPIFKLFDTHKKMKNE